MNKRLSLSAVGVALALTPLVPGTAAGDTSPWASDTLAGTSAEALAVAGYWSAGGGAALRRATPFQPENLRPPFAMQPPVGPTGEQGSVAPGHELGYEPPAEDPQGVVLPKTVGKVFFVDGQGRERWCSATSIESAHRNVVATAAHCVYDPAVTGEVMDKWVFVPGYYQGKSPYGIYVGERVWTHRDFDASEDYDFDYAFANVHNGVRLSSITPVTQAEYDAHTGAKWIQDGVPYTAAAQDNGRLGDNVGGQGLIYNRRPDYMVYAFGYPASPHPDGDSPYSGVTMKWSYGRVDHRYVSTNPAANSADNHVGIKSSFTPGADGAPMLASYGNRERLGYVSGLVSYFVDYDGNGRYDQITSAYFDGETGAVYREAAQVATGPVG
ncbi:trypsin-like serine peptidase [Microbispora sp. NPDC004025]